MSETQKYVEIKRVGDVTTARLNPDDSESHDFEEIAGELISIVEGGTHNKLLIDLGNVHYMQSTGLGKLVSLEKKLNGRDGKLRLCCLQPAIRELFEITGLDDVFEVFPTEADGLKGF